jgi:predicted RNase H-like HicB family nuclease
MSVMLIDPQAEYPTADERYRDESTSYVIVVETDGANWSAYVPDLPGVIAASNSRTEVRSLISEAIEFHLEGLRAEGEPIPAPSAHGGLQSEPSDDV